MSSDEKSNNLKTDNANAENKSAEPQKEPVKKTQGQLIQEALGLAPKDVAEIERTLSVINIVDFFSEETLEFAYKNRSIEMYKSNLERDLDALANDREENKVLKYSFQNKNVVNTIYDLKGKAEKLAASKGIKGPMDKKMRLASLLMLIPMLVIIILSFVMPDLFMVSLIVICVFCMVSQVIKGKIVKKWFDFKEQNKTQFYMDNRDQIMMLKSYTAEILTHLRSNLLARKFPLQLLKFRLYSKDYEGIKSLGQRRVRGATIYEVTLDYPPGVEPFPIPEALLAQTQQQDVLAPPKEGKLEKNFVALLELQAKGGIITKFVPALKTALADKINEVLNECEFEKAEKSFSEIIPSYSKGLVVYCPCGEVAKLENVQICIYQQKFKFYLFEGEPCKCGEVVYALSLMEDSAEVPESLKPIFLK